jgi:hypothetical protein
MDLEILEKLLVEGNELLSTVFYVPAPSGVKRMYSVYRSREPDRYQKWQSSAQRFVKSYYPSDFEEMRAACSSVSLANHSKAFGILQAKKLLPREREQYLNKEGGHPSIHITNNQSNDQQVTLHIFLDAVKDEITGKDLKALKEIMKDYVEKPEETKEKLIEKVKSFGGDVLSNILANILTNPNIYVGIF